MWCLALADASCNATIPCRIHRCLFSDRKQKGAASSLRATHTCTQTAKIVQSLPASCAPARPSPNRGHKARSPPAALPMSGWSGKSFVLFDSVVGTCRILPSSGLRQATRQVSVHGLLASCSRGGPGANQGAAESLGGCLFFSFFFLFFSLRLANLANCLGRCVLILRRADCPSFCNGFCMQTPQCCCALHALYCCRTTHQPRLRLACVTIRRRKEET